MGIYINEARNEFVSVSIRTIGNNAYRGGDLIEVGAVKFNLKGKVLDTFYAVNNVDYEFTKEDFAKLGFNQSVYDAEKQNDYLWMYKLTEFIQDTTVITYDAYETFNYLKALGLELFNLIDLKAVFFLTDKRFNTSLEYHIKKHKVVTPHIFRALRKPMMLKELFLKEYKKKLKKTIDEYINVIYVEEKKERYRGVTGGLLVYSDGRKETVEDMIDEYDKELSSRYIYEENILGDDILKSVKNLTYMFDGINLDVKHIPPIYFRALYEGVYYLWSPLGLFKEDGFKLEEIYDLGKISLKTAESQIQKHFEDTELYDFCLRVLKFSDPDYEIQDFDYFKEDIYSGVKKLENSVKVFNQYPSKFKNILINQIDDRMTQGVFNYIIDIVDSNLVVNIMYDVEFDALVVDDKGNSELLLDESVYTASVDTLGYVQFSKDFQTILNMVIETISKSSDKLPDANVKDFGTIILDKFDTIENVLMVYDSFDREFMYVITNDTIVVQSGARYTLMLGFDGSVSVKNNKENKTINIKNLYDLYRYSENLYKTADEHYSILERMINMDIEGFNDLDDEQDLHKEYDYSIEKEGYDFNDDLEAVSLDESYIDSQYTSVTEGNKDTSNELNLDELYNQPLFSDDAVNKEESYNGLDINEVYNNVSLIDENVVEDIDDYSLDAGDNDNNYTDENGYGYNYNEDDYNEDNETNDVNVSDLESELELKTPFSKLNNAKKYNIELDTDLTKIDSKDYLTEDLDNHVIDRFISDDFKDIGMNLDALSKIPVGFYANDKKSMSKVIKNIVKIVEDKGITVNKDIKLNYYDGVVILDELNSKVLIEFDSAVIKILNTDKDVGIKIE